MTPQDDNSKIAEMIKDIRIAILSTVEADGDIHSRPMGTTDFEFDGTLWFFTQRDSEKVDEIQGNRRVAVSYAEPEKNNYVCLTGSGELVLDKAKMNELWNPILKAWFPEGLDDPQIALLKISVERAEYWDGPSSKLVQLFNLARTAISGESHEGDHGQVTVR
jgi:general stress protein 26